MLPQIVIVGRPNVGKSTLFNRLVGRRSAIVDPSPGVTRDRREGIVALGSEEFTVIDTAGLTDCPMLDVGVQMQKQTLRAVENADVILFLIDALVGVTPLDKDFANLLRKPNARVILVANKCESKSSYAGLLEAYQLGFGEPVVISAEHGIGIPDLADVVGAAFETLGPHASVSVEEFSERERLGSSIAESGPLQLAIIGRPNVGKSTLVNTLLGSERVITGPEPGITRDAISIMWNWRGNKIKLVDTAGMRRKARVSEKLEKLSVGDALEAVRYSHVALLVVDATMMPERQDLVIARHVIDEGRAIVIAINKWDAVGNGSQALNSFLSRIEISLPQIRGVPVVKVSALNCQGTQMLLKEVVNAYGVWNRRIGTASLNKWLAQAIQIHPPPISKGRRIRIRYITQSKNRPPTFVVFVNRPRALPESYIRYLTNGIRETFTLPGIPIRINLRGSRNPYVEESK
ncbi:MAG: ribosome biogenesis GTPase Der [Pseudomonadota bacterium]|nr:ribosome biogenesis GTPase Der [Pseudomonadota bacterium]